MNSTRDQIDAESRKDPERLEREIDQQRDTIGNIVSALENKLSPGEIVDRVMRASKGTGGEFAKNLGTVVRANPMPTLLASVGLVWLYASRHDTAPVRQPATPSYGRTYASPGLDSSTDLGSSSYSSMDDDSQDESGGIASSIKEKAANMRGGIAQKASHLRDGASHLRENAAGKLQGAKHRVGQGAQRATQTVRQQAGRAGEGFNHMMDTNPMVVGAIGIGIGALLGAALPTTRKEDQLLGQTGDKLRSKAGEATQVVREKGREVAQSVRETGSQTIKELGGAPGSGQQQASTYGAGASQGGIGSTSASQNLGGSSGIGTI